MAATYLGSSAIVELVIDRVLAAAGELLPADLRSLVVIHLVTAQQLGSDLGHVVTYDERMLDAARLLGLPTRSPR
jgi:predicted nucleic acid-binding protein